MSDCQDNCGNCGDKKPPLRQEAKPEAKVKESNPFAERFRAMPTKEFLAAKKPLTQEVTAYCLVASERGYRAEIQGSVPSIGINGPEPAQFQLSLFSTKRHL
jgi:hypothetical protein